MSMLDSTLAFHQPLTPSQLADLRFAASKMTGAKRRAFEAAMTLKYCEGNPLQAETIFGWSRRTVALGLAERRTGIICLGAQSAFSGRNRWEDTHPQIAAALCQLAEAHAQQDPTFRTSLAYTRLTVRAALAALRAQGYREDDLPSPSTMAEVLNRLGFRLRKVVKAKPQKKLKETDAIFDNIEKKTRKRRPWPPSNA
jgi:Rhodopirellula transposase DDE domain